MRRFIISFLCFLLLFFPNFVSAKIVFTAYEKNGANIYVMDDNGNNIQQITNYPRSEKSPRWSPDGKQIAFLRDTDPSTSLRLNTFIMNADGTNVRRLTNYMGNDQGLAFSADGEKLIVSTRPNMGTGIGLYEVDIKTGINTKISDIEMYSVDWSPNGKNIVFVKEGDWETEDDIWIMDADGANPRSLIKPVVDETMTRRYPRFSPDGMQCLYTEIDLIVEDKILPNGGINRSIRPKGTYRYKILNMNNGRSRTLAIPNDWLPFSVAWMHGTRAVLVCAIVSNKIGGETNRSHQIHKYDIATQKTTQLVNELTSVRDADWVQSTFDVSPVGKFPLRWAKLKRTYSDTQ